MSIHEQLSELASQVQQGHPQMPFLLRTIHKQIKDDPMIVTILSDDERATLIAGLSAHTKVVIADSTKPKKKALSKMSEDDF